MRVVLSLEVVGGVLARTEVEGVVGSEESGLTTALEFNQVVQRASLDAGEALGTGNWIMALLATSVRVILPF